MCSVQNTLFSVRHMQYHTSTTTDQVRQGGWAFVQIVTLLAGLCPMGQCLVGFLLKSVGWYSSDLNLHIKRSPNCAAFSVACASLSVHITPIVMSAPPTAAKARIPRKCMPLSQRHHLPTPALLPDLLQLYSPSRPLHPSTDTRLPRLPLCRCKMKGDYAFPPSGPSAWNSLPVHVGNETTTDTFKSAVSPYLSTSNFLNC